MKFLLIFLFMLLFIACDNSTDTNNKSCKNECTEKGSFCSENSLYNCSVNSEGCYIKSIIKNCGDEKICESGECFIKDCEQECSDLGYFCENEKRYECGSFDSDFCHDKRDAFCGSDEYCQAGKCRPNCEKTNNGIEICDGLDNDCNDLIDDNIEEYADNQNGVCLGQKKLCKGVEGWAEPDYTLITEYEETEKSCDGLDNDCNGEADNDLVVPDADKKDGVCTGSFKICKGVDGWAEPDYTLITGYEELETICDGFDNDCDGSIDNNLIPDDADNQNGICLGQKKLCKGLDGWSEPDYSLIAKHEELEVSCDGLDNDCDGNTDNNLTIPDADNIKGICIGSVKICNGIFGWTEPNYTLITGYEETEKACDGLDNDCDGTIDNNLIIPDASKTDGVCIGSKKICTGLNGWVEPDYTLIEHYEETEASCDGFDNDCNDSIDEGFPDTDDDGLLDCLDNCPFISNINQENGDNDKLGTVCDCYDNNSDIELMEICDGVDNNCNGLVDEGDICSTTDCSLESYDNHSYLFCSSLKSWDNARRFCNERNYNLVTIEDYDENIFVKSVIFAKNINHSWIGLSDIRREDYFKWESGISSNYRRWAPGEPNNYSGEEDCVEIWQDELWNDSSCGSQISFICEQVNDGEMVTPTIAKSCKEILDNGDSVGSGVYYINIGSEVDINPVLVLCDMTTDGGGWTLVASWNYDYNWTLGALSKGNYFGAVIKDTVSSNFGDIIINDFRITAANSLSDIDNDNAKADWYYHYNISTRWKKLWSPNAHSGDNSEDCSNGYISIGGNLQKQSLKKFDYSHNIKFDYTNNAHKWNNLSDWGKNNNSSYCNNIANYWGALTTSGIDFGVHNYIFSGGSHGDGSLGILIENNTALKTGQDVEADYSALVGYDDDYIHAAYGDSADDPATQGNRTTDDYGDSTKLWWWIR